ncbi:MAG TPA: hypothetical protein VEN79_16390, partial [Terriglobia bacterium]|nr:hypothetical protein [Terriglobia bacterium]
MAKKRARPPAAVVQTRPSWADGRSSRIILLALAAIVAMGWFSPEISDSDFWWHLKTGQYIVEKHTLPVPDPFAFTTATAVDAYPGEALTRHFNLTHEWLAQVVFYLIWRIAGYGGLVLFRALLLSALCVLVGLVAYRRCGSFYWALAAAFTTATMARPFAVDRPYIITFFFVAATIAILEFERWLWLLPPLFLVWANSHGGFFLGWVVLGAYCVEALLKRRGQVPWWSAAAILISGLNPNTFRIPLILKYYGASFVTAHLQEWARPPWRVVDEFTVLLFGTSAVLLWARRRVRLADWLLFAAFAAAALIAQRNVILIGLLAPILIASYFPWRPNIPPIAQFAAALVAIGVAAGTSASSFFELRAAEWKYPAGAAGFLLQHHIRGPIFNTYEHGGYLIWRLWPNYQVFIDGRSLSESVFQDYIRILFNRDQSDGKSARELLNQYGIQTIVMDTFEHREGYVYGLAVALADPQQAEWKLVY